ncbi:HAD-IB family phosphatase [Candidatus Micrarchaeota archaeon]|nr:HAD-IB family phosphatase [Candidatus Micrarchaeota archaeon]
MIAMAKTKAAFFDVDGTLTRGFYIIDFPEYLVKKKCFHPPAMKRIRSLLYQYRKNKEKNYGKFATKIVNAIAGGFEGFKERRVRRLGGRYNEEHQEKLFGFSKKLLGLFRKEKFILMAISGSPEEVISPFCKKMGIRNFAATSFVAKNGVYTGEVKQNCAVFETKSNVLKELVRKHDIDLTQSAGFGDTEQDAAILNQAGIPFAVSPNAELTRIAKKENWPIIRDDGNAIETVKKRLKQKTFL